MRKYKNENCNVCNKISIKKISRISYVSKKDRINWIHDSTFELLGLKKTEIYMGLCLNCFHSSIFPKFDTNKLYQNNIGYLTRKKFYEYYFPDKLYENSSGQLSCANLKKIENEFKRISIITKELLKKHISLLGVSNSKKINILDWGGGDGYLTNLIKIILESTFNLSINVDVYDLSKSNDIKKKKILYKKYDFILLSHVLEHVHDLEKLITNIKRCMNTNSFIIIEVPDERMEIIKSLILRKNIYLNYHVNYFTRNSLIYLFGKYGFFGDFSYIKSSYRGSKNLSIFGIVNETKRKKYFKFMEIPNLLFYIFRKFFMKMIN